MYSVFQWLVDIQRQDWYRICHRSADGQHLWSVVRNQHQQCPLAIATAKAYGDHHISPNPTMAASRLLWPAEFCYQVVSWADSGAENVNEYIKETLENATLPFGRTHKFNVS